jgi:hypothetical protein
VSYLTAKSTVKNTGKSESVAKKSSTNTAKAAGSRNNDNIKINGPQMKILKTVAKLQGLRVETSRDIVQSMSGNSKTEQGFVKNLGILRKKGLIEPGSTVILLTDQGRQLVGVVDPSSLSNNEFLTDIKTLVSKKAGKIIDFLIDGTARDRTDTAFALGYDLSKLSGYDKDLSKLSSLGFLQRGKTMIQLTNKCFPLGRPDGTKMEL